MYLVYIQFFPSSCNACTSVNGTSGTLLSIERRDFYLEALCRTKRTVIHSKITINLYYN